MTAITRATRACIIREEIDAGYGIEDIVVRRGFPDHIVRLEVQQLRDNGHLKKPSWKTLGELARASEVGE